MFIRGETAVYPVHGIGVIEAIEQRVIGGVEQHVYVMRLLASDMTITIPVHNQESVGLRPIMSSDEAERVFTILGARGEPCQPQPWNRRYRAYMEKIKSGIVDDLAEVFRDLSLLRRGKSLSYGERKMLDTARDHLVTELALALGCDKSDITHRLEGLFV